jgi:hypothetical protein
MLIVTLTPNAVAAQRVASAVRWSRWLGDVSRLSSYPNDFRKDGIELLMNIDLYKRR